MRENVVYILGAGFSAPLGLPVIANFLSRSKDLYAEYPERFAHFKEVFALVQELSAAKNYYSIDLSNIEEILSLLEMGEFAGAKSARVMFVKYLQDVVMACTPEPRLSASPAPDNWWQAFLGPDQNWMFYAYFVASLCSVAFRREVPKGPILRETCVNPSARYAVVTLNYDVVLETAAALINRCTTGDSNVAFCTTTTKKRGDPSKTVLVKLHGSVDDESIVPPTWNKGGNSDISPAWSAALSELRNANQIRFVGYSLPETDAYVRYLLKYAAVDAYHLKRVDVLCLDPEGTVEQRYRSFIEVSVRFARVNVISYLTGLFNISSIPQYPNLEGSVVPHLERLHEQFMSQHGAEENS